MKRSIYLEVLSDKGAKGLELPTLTKTNKSYLIEWHYQRTSFACQGQWAKYSSSIPLLDWDDKRRFQEEIRLTEFIKREYSL